jgi:hypothetical protein
MVARITPGSAQGNGPLDFLPVALFIGAGFADVGLLGFWAVGLLGILE